MPHAITTTDPLAQFRDGARIKGSDHPMPLIGTAIDVRIRGGLAFVRTERRFRNAEAQSIEVTITFPVPVHATLVALTAAIDGRHLTGRAQRKAQARESYEAAIDAGKTAVLHEEAMRGIHMLSIGHVPAGKEIAVTDVWAMPIGFQDGAGLLRIPTTVGDIYGRSPLPDSDDLVHASVRHAARLTVATDTGTATVAGATLREGAAEILLNRPVDIRIAGWAARPLSGIAADGRSVTLKIAPAPEPEAPLDAALLLDQSGSMSEAASLDAGGLPVSSKHDAMLDGLRAVLAAPRPGDRLRLFQFDNRCEEIQALGELWGPHGGTSIGPALAQAARACEAIDIAIVTDGKSHDIDVQALARTGKRFTVVLVGEDSLDAHVGHLAALTGGQIFITSGAETAAAIGAAARSLRRRHLPRPAIEGAPQAVAARIAGMDIEAFWNAAAAPSPATEEARWIGAVAAALAIPRMAEDAAADLAAAHGIVCHLTSLVLVDDAAVAQDAIPAQRKVPLMTPATQMAAMPVAAAPPMPFARARASLFAGGAPPAGPAQVDAFAMPEPDAIFLSPPEPLLPVSLQPALGRIDWSQAEALRRGDTSSLPGDILPIFFAATALPEIMVLAQALGTGVIQVVVALLAKAAADADRMAARLSRAILGTADPALIEAAERATGLI